MVVHSIANYRGPALTGDVTIQTAEVTEKSVDEDGRHLVHVKHLMTNQNGKTMCTGSAEIALPKKPG
jgi:acyl dehydratase